MKGIVGFLSFLITSSVFGTHLRAGYISATPLSCTEYKITIRVYTDTGSPLRFGDGLLNFGDGSSHTTLTTENQPTSSREIGLVEYSINHTYPATGTYVISYSEPNRNQGIINISNSVDTRFFIETKLIIDPLMGCFQTPIPITPASFVAPIGDTLHLSFAASSSENLYYQYELINPLTVPLNETQPQLAPYTFPENVSINTFNGLLTWDTRYKGMFQPGEYVFTIRINYWKITNDGTYKYAGYTLVDTQIILVDFPKSSGSIISENFGDNGRVYIPNGGSKTIKVVYKNTDINNIELKAYSELTNLPEVLSFNTYDSAANIKVGILTLNSLPIIDREEPYLITIRGAEKPEYFPNDINFMLFTRDVFQNVITNVKEELVWSVYPNPVRDKLTLNVPTDTPISVSLLDAQGKKIGNWSNPQTIDLSNMPAGFYFVEIVQSAGKKIIKIIKQ